MARPDLFQFLQEEQHYADEIKSIFVEELDLVKKLESLFSVPLDIKDFPENALVVQQMLWLTHYSLLHSVSSIIKGHVSISFHSLRTAIDAALIAHTIITDPSKQQDYIDRKNPFKQLKRYLGNELRRNPEGHGKIKYIFERHSEYSRVASHADIDAFSNRLRLEPGGRRAALKYFEMPGSKQEFSEKLLLLVFDYACVLNVFSDHFVKSLNVSEDWRIELEEFLKVVQARLWASDRSV